MQLTRSTPGVIAGAANQTNAKDNAAAVGGTSNAINRTEAVTGTPTVDGAAAAFGQNQAVANAYRGGSGASDYNPSGAENQFMNYEAQVQGITPAQMAEAMAAAKTNDPAFIAKFMEQHPELAAFLASLPGAVGQAAGAAILFKAMKGNGGTSGGTPEPASPGKTPPASDSPLENQAGEPWYKNDEAAVKDFENAFREIGKNIAPPDGGEPGEPGEPPMEMPDIAP
ncbi:hypothetical protein BAE30_06070 [Acidithiobacillus caldus]|uniref:Uncharacterized protein n=1 Tax=Acidithiobacillus caldus TaxID=33059 RepID=A0A1E7YX98_9PROT|nr:hypothetical protein BAE30_06070 [Acidithiobacillus caldus]